MKAWLLDQLGDISRLRLSETADPTARDGEVVMRVQYAALNPADRYLAEGQYPAKPTFPHILGRDGIGTIIEVGPGVTNWTIGDRALILRSEIGVNRPGTFAEKVAVPADTIVAPPEHWSAEQSAGAPLVYLTAWQSYTTWCNPLPPSNVLITGASGGVGVAAIQLGAAMGHKVIAMSRGDAKRDALLKLGALAALDPTDTQWRKKCRDLLNGGRIDLAIDNIGGPLFSELMDALAENAKVACVGRLAGPVQQFNTASLFFRRITVKGIFVGAYTHNEAQAAWRQVLEATRKTGAFPLVDHIFPFDQLPHAFARLREGPLGKVLLHVGA